MIDDDDDNNIMIMMQMRSILSRVKLNTLSAIVVTVSFDLLQRNESRNGSWKDDDALIPIM
jgi:hypothetical protein